MTHMPNHFGASLRAHTAPRSGLYAVTLIDRRTGMPLRAGGRTVTVFSDNPDAAAQDLLTGRDRSLWTARVDPVGLG